MSDKWTPTVSARKCPCGHPACAQYTLSTQGSMGFGKADADLYVAAPDMAAAMEEFCRRVEVGEIRSKATYAKFKAILAKARNSTPTKEINP